MAHESTLALVRGVQLSLGQAKALPRFTECLSLETTSGKHPDQCPAQVIAQGHVQSGFEYLQEWSLHNLSGQPGPVFLHSDSKRNFISYLDEIPCISICACCLLSCPWAQWRKSVSILFVPKGFVPIFFVSPWSLGVWYAQHRMAVIRNSGSEERLNYLKKISMELPCRADVSSRVTPAENTALQSKVLNLSERHKKKYHVVLKSRMLNYRCPSCHKPAHDVFGGRTCRWCLSAEGSENTCDTGSSDLPAVPCTLFLPIPGLSPWVQA